MLFRLLICRCSLVVWYEKFKSVSDWQDVDALMCSVFIYLGLHYRLYICIFYLAAFKRHYALHLAIAPEFCYCSYRGPMCLFYVCSGLLEENMYICIGPT